LVVSARTKRPRERAAAAIERLELLEHAVVRLTLNFEPGTLNSRGWNLPRERLIENTGA
jgi:hypothetical protein